MTAGSSSESLTVSSPFEFKIRVKSDWTDCVKFGSAPGIVAVVPDAGVTCCAGPDSELLIASSSTEETSPDSALSPTQVGVILRQAGILGISSDDEYSQEVGSASMVSA